MNILSTSALKGNPKSSAYAASKYAQKGFTDALRNEVRGDNITVIGIFHGGMKTDFFNEQVPDEFDRYMDPVSVAQKIVTNLKIIKVGKTRRGANTKETSPVINVFCIRTSYCTYHGPLCPIQMRLSLLQFHR